MSNIDTGGKMTALRNDVEKTGDLHRGQGPERPSHSLHKLIPKYKNHQC